jgi:hypothetical protein
MPADLTIRIGKSAGPDLIDLKLPSPMSLASHRMVPSAGAPR